MLKAVSELFFCCFVLDLLFLISVLQSGSMQGHVVNESGRVSSMRSRAKSMTGRYFGFPEVLQEAQQEDISGFEIGWFVEEKLGATLQDLAGADFAGWSAPQVALLAQKLIRILQVLHTKVAKCTLDGWIYLLTSFQDKLLSGQVHNDLKPSNVVIGLGDQSTEVFLIDLDICSVIMSTKRGTRPKVSEKVQGTPRWCGTDVLLGWVPSFKSDLDALGQVLIWACTGSLPWTKERVPDLAKEKSEWRSLPWSERRGVQGLPGAKFLLFRSRNISLTFVL